MSYIAGDERHNEMQTLIKIYQAHHPDIVNEKKWSDYPKHISMLLADLRVYCTDEGMDFDMLLFKASVYREEQNKIKQGKEDVNK